jgi:5'(3')-deoxyribonucleotidase
MKSPTILLDVDSVLVDFVSPICEAFGVSRWLLRTHCITKEISQILNIPEIAVSAFIERRGFCEGLKPLPWARGLVGCLNDIGKVYIVTAPYNSSAYWHGERLASLSRNFGIKADDVIFTSKKSLVRGDVLIDDNIHHIDTWKESNPEGIPVWVRTPENSNAVNVRWLDNPSERVLHFIPDSLTEEEFTTEYFDMISHRTSNLVNTLQTRLKKD